MRVFGAADGKSRSPTLRTNVEQVEKVAVSDNGALVAVSGKVGKNGKLQLELYDAVSGGPYATFRIDETVERYTSRWCGLAFDNAGKLFACARVSAPGKAETRIMTFTLPGLALQGTPTVVAGGSNATFLHPDGRETGEVYSVGVKQSFQYVPARKDIVYLVDYCCDGGKRFEVVSWDPATGQTTTHVKSAYRDAKRDAVTGLASAGQDVMYLYYEQDRPLSGGGYRPSQTELVRVGGQSLGKASGLGTVVGYFHESGLMVDLTGRVRARGRGGFFAFPGLGEPRGDASRQWKYAERAAFGFEPDTHRLVRLANSKWVASKPLPPAYMAASVHLHEASTLASAGFLDIAKPEIEASIASDARYARTMPSYLLDFWREWNMPAVQVGRWMLTSINQPTSTSADPTDAQFYMLFGLLAAANGHPAVTLQVAAMLPAFYKPETSALRSFLPMYIALMEASALAANGDAQGALGKLVKHREELQGSKVRNGFYWWPELFAYLHACSRTSTKKTFYTFVPEMFDHGGLSA